jgi:hypothetical protein
MLGYLYGKTFGSKRARANRKEGNRVGAGPMDPPLLCYHTAFRTRRKFEIKKMFHICNIGHSGRKFKAYLQPEQSKLMFLFVVY